MVLSSKSEVAILIKNEQISMEVDLAQGKARIVWPDSHAIRHIDSRIRVGDTMYSTLDYADRSYQLTDCQDAFGSGIELRVVHRQDGFPTLTQVFSIYQNVSYGFLQLIVESESPIESNYIAPMYSSYEEGAVSWHGSAQSELRALLVPFDNDKWVRYESVRMPGSLESYEVSALYENSSRNGIVFGSVTHDAWKTGIRMEGQSNQTLRNLEIYGGAAGEYTRDTLPHGTLVGTRLVSPKIFVGAFDDYREGLSEFGRVCAKAEAPLEWQGGVPFGWNSWSAVGDELSYESYIAASDFLKEVQQNGGGLGSRPYVNFDSFWTNLSVEEMRQAVAHVHANGQKAGIYWTPFAFWGNDFDRKVEGTEGQYTYAEMLLRDFEGNVLPELDGGLAIDPTHPGNIKRTEWMLAQFVEAGFEYIKLDFLGHGALEGKHFLPDFRTGIQAYNYGMSQIRSLLDPEKVGRPFFIHLSIAPLFPSVYAHSRRISCDAFGELKDTEYLLNSLTYGWWINHTLYRFNDPDHTVLFKSYNHEPTSMHEGRSRLHASLISGTLLLMGDDFRLEEARSRARQWLIAPELMSIADKGETFLPLEGDTGDRAADVFYRKDQDAGAQTIYIAVFNYEKDKMATKSIDLSRIGLVDETPIHIEDLWEQTSPAISGGFLTVTLAPSESKIFKLQT
jgi:alpha-galactosidase